MQTYDLVVIGAGSGGLVAATSGHRKGLKTALLEKNKIGGECTHYGCVPSKALIHAANAYHSLKTMTDLGIESGPATLEFGTIMAKVDEIVQGIYQHETPDVFENMGIDVLVDARGASFLDAHTIQMGERVLYAKHVVIATGSAPRLPEIPGMDQVSILHNENFWELREHPGKLVFIGGGVISVELGQALARLGCEVCIMDRNSRIAKQTDPEIGNYLTDRLRKEGVQILTNVDIQQFSGNNQLVYEQDGQTQRMMADHFFLATGRRPHVEGLNLESAGVNYTDRGIQTNDFLQTSVPHIYACGDVTTPFKFTHTASHQANICIDNILTPHAKKNDLSVLPWAIFTEPQIGHVGLTEAGAHEKYGADNVKTFRVTASIDRFITDRKTGGMLKVFFTPDDLVIGAEAIGEHAGEWIQILTVAMKHQIPATEMADTIFSYPTYAEIVKKAFTRYLRSKA
ncbi:MAG: NAD(P)/FAD-dependent oxidoreductase [Bacteroidota bacterium]